MKKHLSDIICVFCFVLVLVWGSLFPPISDAGVEFSRQSADKNECRVTFKILELLR